MKNKKHITIIFLIGMLALFVVQNPYTKQYVTQLTQNNSHTPVINNALYDQIVQASKKYNVAPQNAVLDPVWKRVPGYNGIQVDTTASYNKMKKNKVFDENKLVFKQISPTKHLDNLPVAPMYKGNGNKPMVTFGINVAWGNEYLPSMLKTLKNNNIHATFFLEGRWVKENPDLAKMITDGGNEVGNHSYTHPDMAKLTTDRIKEQLIKTNEVIEATTGKKVTWFAPPSGSFRSETVSVAASLHMKTVLWTVDTIDWQKPSVDVLTNRVLGKIHPGAIILMHPTQASADALPELIKEIKKKKLRIGTLSNLVDEERVVTDNVSNN